MLKLVDGNAHMHPHQEVAISYSFASMPIINEYEDATELIETYGMFHALLFRVHSSRKDQIFY